MAGAMIPQEAQARLDGQLAAVQGKVQTDNPHPLGTCASRAWARGWREVAGW